MEISKEVIDTMYAWLSKRYDNQADKAIVSIVEQLQTFHYAIVELGRGSKLEEVNARFSNFKPTGIGMQVGEVRVWVNNHRRVDENRR